MSRTSGAGPGPWAAVRGWFEKNAQAHVLASFDQGDALTPYQSYLRVWLAEMFLAKRVQWLRERFPAVHAEVRLPFAGQPAVSFTRVVRPGDDQLGEGVLINYPLTELLPTAAAWSRSRRRCSASRDPTRSPPGSGCWSGSPA